DTQRSLEKINKIELLPAKEFPLNEESIELFRQQWRSQFSGNPMNCPMYQEMSDGICTPGIEYYLPFFFEKTATFFDYLPEKSLLVSVGNLHFKAEEFWREISARYEQRANDITRPLIAPREIFIPVDDIFSRMKQYTRIKIHSDSLTENSTDFNFVTRIPPALHIDYKATQPLEALQTFLTDYTGRVLFCAETTGRREVLLQLFNSIQLHPTLFSSWETFLTSTEKYGMTVALLEDGVALENPPLALIAEAQLFGKRVIQQRRRKETSQDVDAIVKNLTELQVGAPIVHIDHGVGRYLGLQTLSVGEQITEFLCIEYADNTKLYVPVSSLHFISRYSGVDPEQAPLNKLGTEQWQRAKRKAAEEVRDVAAELLDIYAKRAALLGFACQETDGQYAAFSASFPFEETPDQKQAIEQVIADMHSDKAMDRLVCGDVGFGKTEVAMRAAFIAVQNGKQVA
ncbi:MAG TPA: CarD family transcriptional regulator, partial [Gammaproteobacteria bacterium]|nr:CarD family transcriptional regulator [Gammaproteobacteria bacterium]